MTRSIYVAAPEGQTGKSVVALGLLDTLLREVESVGVFRPLVRSGGPDDILEMMLGQPGVTLDYDDAVGITYDEMRSDPERALQTIVDKFGRISPRFDAIVVLGSDYADVTSPTELSFNADVAANLGSSLLLVVSGHDRDVDDIRSAAESALNEFTAHHVQTIGVFANRVNPEILEGTARALRDLTHLVVAALPSDPVLIAPTLRDQFEAVGARQVLGNPDLLDRESQDVVVAAMTLPNILSRLVTEATVLMPSDRSDLLPGLILAHHSGSFPQLTGVILTGGYPIPDNVRKLFDGMHLDLPIGMTDQGTYTTAKAVFNTHGLFTSSPRKVEISRRIFAEHVDAEALIKAIEVEPSKAVTPLMFGYQLNELARRDRRRIVMPESSDDRILESASILLQRGVADLTLLGDPVEIKTRASAMGWVLDGAEMVNPTNPELVERFSEEYAKLRAHKGVTVEQAREKMKDLSYFGTMMVHLGMADGMVSGAINTTANTIRPSLEFIKTKPGVKVVSGSFLMCMPDRVHVYADCAVNPDPTAEQLADIAISSAETAVAFGIEPRVAMLSYSTGTSGSGADVDKVRQATELVRERRPDLALEGPIQFDAAVDPAVARTKLPDSAVAGRATVFIFPDLNTGNNTYKAVQRSSGAVAIGPILQGLKKAVNDLSRGALVDDIVNTVVITAIQAQTETH
ncbi:phosphate acetyltransferase [Micropruina sonneratiae]|uniref:phosphate acetyltransferase n=1 Tax=Micropruina sonneratiae TaxID=2986940 RepID=UPI0022277675|nr:phosphate acetyltransferase [Micropruina sp. KQZ13P-5]MCW3159206.1 phosphate acetyltransferase [Micropruina sp. KQZ13P-5]